MSVGYELTKTVVDRRAGGLATRLRDVLRECAELDGWLDTQVNTDLENLGYSPTEVAQLKSAFGDAAELDLVYRGEATVPTAKDYRTFMGLLIGPR